MLQANLSNCAGVAFCGTLPTGTGIELYVRTAETIKAAGLPLLVDSWQNIAPVLKVGGNMILKVNAEELQVITSENNTEKALSAAINSFPLSAIAVTDGPGNARLAFDHQLYSFELPKLEHIVSPLGCGDTAAAVFLSEYLRGKELPDAFASALAAASANCLTAVCGSFDITNAKRIQKEIVITNKQF
ncbi:MAG: carbohydrate kinase family protein, partial [Victivallaceae bacterium]